jgi:hypothetical protein
MVFLCYNAKSYASGREELVPFEAKMLGMGVDSTRS